MPRNSLRSTVYTTVPEINFIAISYLLQVMYGISQITDAGMNTNLLLYYSGAAIAQSLSDLAT